MSSTHSSGGYDSDFSTESFKCSKRSRSIFTVAAPPRGVSRPSRFSVGTIFTEGSRMQMLPYPPKPSYLNFLLSRVRVPSPSDVCLNASRRSVGIFNWHSDEFLLFSPFVNYSS